MKKDKLNKLTEEKKKYLDSLSFDELLRKWRFEPSGSPLTSGEVGDYFYKIFQEKRAEISPEEFTRISKRVGW